MINPKKNDKESDSSKPRPLSRLEIAKLLGRDSVSYNPAYYDFIDPKVFDSFDVKNSDLGAGPHDE